MNSYILGIENIYTQMNGTEDLFSLKKQVAEKLKEAHATLSSQDFGEVLSVAEPALSKNCGCHEDLEQLESILDNLSESSIIEDSVYKRIVENTACNRWL